MSGEVKNKPCVPIYSGESYIISASRVTDIPACYGDWFMNRIKQGFVGVPRKGPQPTNYLVSLDREKVKALVFWSKNYVPFLDNLITLKEKGYPILCHYTITGLPKPFEQGPDLNVHIDAIQTMADILSPEQISWRYDPIVVSEKTNDEWHLKNFSTIASALKDCVKRCYFSFVIHGKNVKNFNNNLEDEHLKIIDPDQKRKKELASQLAKIANENKIKLYSCCENFHDNALITRSGCIEFSIIENTPELSNIEEKKSQTRPLCLCRKSIDIGFKDTCTQGCGYCSATSHDKAQKIFKNEYNPKAVFLGKPVIETYSESKNNILLIAPHGFPGNDDNTGILTRLLAKELKCRAVINEAYRRPDTEEGEETNRELLCADLNNLKSIEEAELEDEWLGSIRDYTEEILKKYKKVFVLWIHGIGDKGALEYQEKYVSNEPPDILIGYGQGNPDKFTANDAPVKELEELLKAKEIKAEIAKRGSKYCAKKPDNLTQLFSDKAYRNGHKKNQFESIQLEIKYTDFRDEEHLDKTATIIADALIRLTVPKSIPGQHHVDLASIKCHTVTERKYIFRESDFTDEKLQKKQDAEIRALAESIKSEGLLQPIVLLQRKDDTCIILCGYRRYQAMKLLKAATIEAKTYREDELTEEQCFKISITENGARRDLSAVDIADFLVAAQKQSGMTNKELADAYAVLFSIGKSEKTINKYLQVARIKKESPDIINAVRNGKLSFSVAADVLAPIASVRARNSFYEQIVNPFRFTRPELIIVKKYLKEIANKDIYKALQNKDVVAATQSALESDNPREHFLRQLGLISNDPNAHEMDDFDTSVSDLKHKVFGDDLLRDDLSVSVKKVDNNEKELLFQVRITSDNLTEMLNKLKELADENESIQTMLK